MRVAWLLVALAGCPGPEDPATPDGAMQPDSSVDAPDTTRLTIAWATVPVVPGTTAAGHRLDDVQLRMENLKATVDVDPTDPNTTQDEVKLQWTAEDAPESITFAKAPAGRYTSIVLKLDEGDGEEAFEIRGRANDNDSFRFEDTASVSISMSCNVMLAPGEHKTLTIEIDLQTAVDAINIEALGAGEGFDHNLEADDEPVAMATFRAALQQAFSVREE